MLAVAAEMIRADQFAMADDPDRTASLVFAPAVSRNGVTGAPNWVSIENGRRWFGWMAEDLSVRRGMAETPPLDQSYFTRSE
jgi:hypothetical protein